MKTNNRGSIFSLYHWLLSDTDNSVVLVFHPVRVCTTLNQDLVGHNRDVSGDDLFVRSTNMQPESLLSETDQKEVCAKSDLKFQDFRSKYDGLCVLMLVHCS